MVTDIRNDSLSSSSAAAAVPSPPKKRKENHNTTANHNDTATSTMTTAGSPYPPHAHSSTSSSSAQMSHPQIASHGHHPSQQQQPSPYPYSVAAIAHPSAATGGYGGYPYTIPSGPPGAYPSHRTGPSPPHMPQSYGQHPQGNIMYCQPSNSTSSNSAGHNNHHAGSNNNNSNSNNNNSVMMMEGASGPYSQPPYGRHFGSPSGLWGGMMGQPHHQYHTNPNTSSSSSSLPAGGGKTPMRVSSSTMTGPGSSAAVAGGDGMSLAGSVRSVSSSHKDPYADHSSLNMNNRDKGRGNYRCGKCGVPKKGHVCPYQPKLKRRADEPPPEMRTVATQVEMDEFLVVRRLNLEIQGYPESYTAAPMGDVGAEVHPTAPPMATSASTVGGVGGGRISQQSASYLDQGGVQQGMASMGSMGAPGLAAASVMVHAQQTESMAHLASMGEGSLGVSMEKSLRDPMEEGGSVSLMDRHSMGDISV